MVLRGYELEYNLVGFLENLNAPERLHSSWMCCYVHSALRNTLRHKLETRPRSWTLFWAEN